MARRAKFQDDEVVVATQGIAMGEYVVSRGTRLRGDHPLVRQLPQHFVADGVPEGEWPNMWATMREPAQEPARQEIPDAEAVVAIESFLAGHRHVPKGARLRRDDPLVKAHPQLFRTPALPVAKGA